MAWVKFTRPYTVKDDEAASYEEGEVVEVSDASADHFCNRGAAVKTDAKGEPLEKPVRHSTLPKKPGPSKADTHAHKAHEPHKAAEPDKK